MSTADVELAESQRRSFSLELSQDQRDIRDWVPGFASDVVRPASGVTLALANEELF